MINRLSNVSLFIHDYDRAKAFYTDKLGFEVRLDQPMGPDSRWVAVAPKGAETEVILYKPDENWEHYRQVVGKSQAMVFDAQNIIQLCEDLKAKGVKVVQEPISEPWGIFVMIEDSEGNHILLVEQPAG